MTDLMPDFPRATCHVNGVTLSYRKGGQGPPLLLLHGFPQTHLEWRKVAGALARQFTLVMPDLRGYGDSAKPPSTADHLPYAKRTMAADVHALMMALGHAQYAVCGHDRGGRVAHRLALDQPAAVTRLMVLDIVPTATMYARTDRAFATAYYHWFFLIQPAPLPEIMLGNSARAYLERAFGVRDGRFGFVEAAAFAEYERCFVAPGAIAAACEDYRASATIDLEHDADGARLSCPVHVVWGERGVIGTLFDPIADWQEKATTPVTGTALPAGHFLPEEDPDGVLAAMQAFFTVSAPQHLI